MTKLIGSVVLFAAVWCGLAAAPAQAQNYRSYLSMAGNDGQDCSYATPCRTFNRAVTQTRPKGTIVCRDTITDNAIFGISKSLTIACPGSSTAAINVNSAAADIVVLSGLIIDPGAVAGPALNVSNAGTVIVDKAHIGSGIQTGINLNPTGPAKLIVNDSVIAGNGNGDAAGAGILIKPQPGGSAQVAIERVNVSGNLFGIAIDGSNSTGGINATIADSVLASNKQDGVVATTSGGHAPIGVMVRVTRSANNGFGIRSIGSNVTVRVEGSTVTGNGTGLAASGGGALLSLGNNAIQANGAKGAFTGSLALE